MKTSAYLLFLSLLLIAFPVRSQVVRNCATMEVWQEMERSNPLLRQRQQQIEDFTNFRAKDAFRLVRDVITIPVVVHVIYHEEGENISDGQIYSQLRVLNEDYRRRNQDAGQTPARFRKLATDTGIEFVLANVDPRGNPTNGITRTYTEQDGFVAFENDVKSSATGGVDPWPADRYLNIWICNLGMGVLGYAQFPGGPAATDGVVIDYRYFGTMGTVSPPFHLGRTATHEVGHWLNLRHIWGDGPCGHDDYVADTPLAERPNQGCATERYSCGSLDMVQNFMDYTDDACMNLFTQGQAARMRTLFSPGGARESLLFSNGYNSALAPLATLESPGSIEATAITASSALLQWSPVSHATGYAVRFRPLNTSSWRQQSFEATSIRISDLPACTYFEFQVASLNPSTTSAYSPAATFRTQGCNLGVPENLGVSDLQASQAVLYWDAVPGAEGYLLQYRKAGTRNIYTLDVKETPYALVRGLMPGNVYQFRVKAVSPGNYTPFSKVHSFRTADRQQVSQAAVDYLRVYPDAAGNLRVALEQPEANAIKISVVDPSGARVYETPAQRVAPYQAYDLPTGPLRGGEYQLQVEDEQGFLHVKSVRLPE